MSTPELNELLKKQKVPIKMCSSIKQRRRTLKNRNYSKNSREKLINSVEDLKNEFQQVATLVRQVLAFLQNDYSTMKTDHERVARWVLNRELECVTVKTNEETKNANKPDAKCSCSKNDV